MKKNSETTPVKPDEPWMVHALKPGHAILEYVVERTLGGGGFGITYLARDANLNLFVAIKEYLPADLAMRAEDGGVQVLGSNFKDQFDWGLERFISEARVLAAFRHPNIVRVLRYFSINGTAYIVMEFETGESLKKWIPIQKKLDQATLLKMIHPLLDGLEMVHKAGYLHRDIKPENIYIRSDYTPVLIDFGSARSTHAEDDMTSIVSPGFAPFEQYHSKGNQGPWTDLYSLAAVMYWSISGKKPQSSIERIKKDSMEPLAKLIRHKLINESLLGVIDWALNQDEKLRPQSVAEFRRRLHESTQDGSTVALAGNVSSASPGWEAGGVVSGRNVSIVDQQGSNLVCSILFLDIIAYSKTSVNEQYQLKSTFNQLIASKLAHVPDSSRITLDTGDGAVICFMGDPEDVLYASRGIQSELTQQDRLQVRMGLHIGPVRIINDLNGQNNVIGDGINVAQRVMSFADNNSLVVSRAFYEIVACITEGGERGFSYIGERRDKHDRVHEIYAAISVAESGIDSDSTTTPYEISGTMQNSIDPGVIASMERELAFHLGPLAPVLMRKVKARATSETELRNILALSISDLAMRESFLQQSPVLGRYNESDSTRVTSALSQRLGSSGIKSSPTGSKPTVTTMPIWVAPEAVTLLEKLLAKNVGPMARVLVKKEAQKTRDYSALCQALALHVDDLDSRTQFIKDTSSLRKLKK